MRVIIILIEKLSKDQRDFVRYGRQSSDIIHNQLDDLGTPGPAGCNAPCMMPQPTMPNEIATSFASPGNASTLPTWLPGSHHHGVMYHQSTFNIHGAMAAAPHSTSNVTFTSPEVSGMNVREPF